MVNRDSQKNRNLKTNKMNPKMNGKNMPSYTENELAQEAWKEWYNLKYEKGGKKMENEQKQTLWGKVAAGKKFNWLGLLIEVVKVVIAFVSGTQI